MTKDDAIKAAEAHRAAVLNSHPLSETVIGYRRQRLTQALAPRGEFEQWLDALPPSIHQIQIVRQSSRRRRDYSQHFETATTYRESDPDVAAVREAEIGDLLDGSALGVNTFRIEKRHLSGGGRSRAYVGTGVALGRTLFLFILNSAAEDNLKGSHDDQAGNAFTAAVQAAVRRLSYTQWAQDIASRMWVHFPDKTRLCRDVRHAVNLVETLRWAGVVLRIADQEFPNLDEASAKLVLSVFLAVSEEDLVVNVTRLFNARFGLLRGGQWLGGEAPPITHQLVREQCDDGLQTWEEENPHRLEPRADAAEMMTGLVDTILTSAGDNVEAGPAGLNPDPKAIPNWKSVAWVAGTEYGVNSREWRHIQRGGLPVHKLSEGGAHSIRKYLADRWIEGWITGRTPWSISVPRVIANNFEVQLTEYQEEVNRPDGTFAVLTRMEMPLPKLECDAPSDCTRDGHLDEDGNHLTYGFGIPRWKWDRVQELLMRTARRSGEHVPGLGHGDDALRYPFATAFAWEDGVHQFKLMSCKSRIHGSCHQLYTRAAGSNPTRAWKKGPDERCLATVVAPEMARALGEDLERLLLGIEHDLVPLTVVDNVAERGATTDPVSRAEAALEQARQDLETAEAAIKKARRVRLTARTELHELRDSDADDEEIKEAEAQLVEAEAMLAEAKAKKGDTQSNLDRCETQVATATGAEERAAAERSATVDLSTPLLVAKALQKTDGTALRVLNDCVLQMLDPQTSTIEVPADDHTKVIVRPTWRFITADTHEVVAHQRTVHVERLPANPKTKTKNVDTNERDLKTIPRLLLHDGLSRSEVGRRFGLGFEPGNSKMTAYAVTRRWLDGHGVTPKLRHALLDAAPIARKTLYLALVGDQGGLDELLAEEGCDQSYADLLVSRYTGDTIVTRGSWAKTWVPGDHAHDRAVVDELMARGGRAPIGDLAAATGLTDAQVERVAHVPPPSQRDGAGTKFGQPAAVLKGEWRSKAVAPLADRVVWLLGCPHADCDGHVTHPLWTPETDPDRHAVHQQAAICPTCRRAPWGTTRYPAAYLRAWTGPTSRDGTTTGMKATRLTPGEVTRMPTAS
jgi:hypothetical protein